MLPRLRGQETFVAETFFASKKQKMFLTLFRNILFFQQMFPRLRGEETMFPQQCFRNNVSPFAGAFMLSVWIDFGFEMRGLKNTQSYKQLLNQI